MTRTHTAGMWSRRLAGRGHTSHGDLCNYHQWTEKTANQHLALETMQAVVKNLAKAKSSLPVLMECLQDMGRVRCSQASTREVQQGAAEHYCSALRLVANGLVEPWDVSPTRGMKLPRPNPAPKPQAKASSRASSSGEHVRLFRMVYNRKKGFQAKHFVGFSCFIACENMGGNLNIRVSNTFLCLHAFGNMSGG